MTRKITKEFILFMGIMLTGLISCSKKYEFPFRDPSLSVDQRVEDLISRMTLQEKVGQMMHTADSIPRLGIPGYNWWNECLHGVARSGHATVFPQSIGLAATWDTTLIFEIASAISDEARAKHHFYKNKGRGHTNIYQGLTFWSPNINIFRDPRWGRGMETYGEDPFLTGNIGVAFIKGLQGNNPKYYKVIATSKHYVVHSGPEPERHSFNAVANTRDIMETYLPAFEMTVKDANVQAVMCAYNRTNGEACCGSNTLLTELLRDSLGFKGHIVSDCGAINDIYRGHNLAETKAEAAAIGVKAGTDLNCGNSYTGLSEAVEKGLLTEPEIDISLKRLMKARFELGMFDPEEMVPYANIPLAIVESDAHITLAEEIARASMVLLKNKNNMLPLDKNIKTLAVIGPNANDVETMYANYNGFARNPVTPLEGLRKKLPDTEIIYVHGCDAAENLPTLEVIPSEKLFTSTTMQEHGLKGEYYGNNHLEGEPTFIRTDKLIDFNWWGEVPEQGFQDNNFSIRWSGFFIAPETGEYFIGGEGKYQFSMELNGEKIGEFKGDHHPGKIYKKLYLEAGKAYPVKIEYTGAEGMSVIRLLWKKPVKDYKKEAIEAAKKADVTILFMGLSPRLEGESMKVEVEGFRGGDRTTLDLPKIQSDLIKSINTVGKPVVLVLMNGSALSINWENSNIPAILEAWYPGQAAGTAIADILFGDYNPSGRLPITFYKSVNDLPDFTDYSMEGKTYRYFRKEPLYSFGYGLSYTTFSYSNLQIPATACKGEYINISVDVSNSGNKDGHEVVQLYLSNKTAPVPVPLRTLKGFTRVFLKAGEKKTISMTLDPNDFSIISESGKRIVEPGLFSISVGGRQPDPVSLANKSVLEGEIVLK